MTALELNQTKIVYVVTLDPECAYTQMTRVSLAALRQLHPSVDVTLLCDRQHGESSEQAARSLSVEVDNYRPIDVPMDTAVDRSRYLKTMMRRQVEGDFLFLDSDAIPVSPLTPLLKYPGDVALALDLNQSQDRYHVNEKVTELYQKLQWTAPRRYFNSGVMMWRDTELAQSLSDKWHQLWKQTQAAGCHKDQPSLNVAIESSNCLVTVLPAKFNAMVEREAWGRCRPTVLHFLKWRSDGSTVLVELVKQLNETGRVNDCLLQRMIDQGYPWMHSDSVSRQVACGRYTAALGCGLRKLFHVAKSNSASSGAH